jgi:lipid II:glycine glycyltransferase (peptidoglycan interpeptide bridge formation enzyme)
MWVRPADFQVLDGTGSPFQSRFWAEIKESVSWKPYAFIIGAGENPEDPLSRENGLLLLVRTVAPGCRIAYVPFGPPPLEGPFSPASLEQLADALAPHLPDTPLFFRFDLPWGSELSSGPASASQRVLRVPLAVQPEATQVLDLTASLESLRESLRTRAKRHLKRCEGAVQIRSYAPGVPREVFDAWYRLYGETARRDRFSPRSRSYLQRMLSVPSDSSSQVFCMLTAAWMNGRMAAGSITLFSPDTAVYLFGASSRDSSLPCSPAYAVLWNSVCAARQHGCREFDLFGVSPRGSETHHLERLSLFKSSFGGSYRERPGTWDVPVKPALYRIYRFLEHRRAAAARSSNCS